MRACSRGVIAFAPPALHLGLFHGLGRRSSLRNYSGAFHCNWHVKATGNSFGELVHFPAHGAFHCTRLVEDTENSFGELVRTRRVSSHTATFIFHKGFSFLHCHTSYYYEIIKKDAHTEARAIQQGQGILSLGLVTQNGHYPSSSFVYSFSYKYKNNK